MSVRNQPKIYEANRRPKGRHPLFCFISFIGIYYPLTDIVIVHIVYINESNPYTPLMSISHIQICYQLLQTHPPTHPSATNPQPFCLPGDDCRTYGRLTDPKKTHPQNPSVKSMTLPALATATSAHRAANRANATSPQRSAHRIPYNDRAAHRANATSPQRSAHRPPHTGNQTSAHGSAHASQYFALVSFGS